MIRNDDLWQKPTVLEDGVAVMCVDPGETTGYVCALLPNSALLRVGPDEWLSACALDPTGTERGMSRIVDVRDWKLGGNPVIGKRHCLWFRYGHIAAPSLKEGGSYLGQEMEAVRALFRVGRTLEVDARKLSHKKLPGMTTIVCEDFILREHTKLRSLLAPVRVTTGMYNWFDSSSMFDIEFYLQQVGSAKHTVDDATLKKLGLYQEGWGHANDACRHLLLYARSYYNQLVIRERARSGQIR